MKIDKQTIEIKKINAEGIKEILIAKNIDGVAIHCDTEEKAIDLLKHLDEMGFRWGADNRLTKETLWGNHRQNTCYFVNLSDSYVLFTERQFYDKNGYTVVEYTTDKNKVVEYVINKNKPKKLKAWELLKRLDELGEKCVGEVYECNGHKFRVEHQVFCGVCLVNSANNVSVGLYGNELLELIEEKFYLQDKFIAETNIVNSYLNYSVGMDSFIVSDKTETVNIKTKFTDEDIVKYSIPRDRYKKIPVKHGE